MSSDGNLFRINWSRLMHTDKDIITVKKFIKQIKT